MPKLQCALGALGLLLSLACVSSAAAADLSDIKLGGVIQVRAIKGADDEGFVFGFERVRVVAKGKLSEIVDVKLQAELNREAVEKDKDGETSNLIKDAVIGLHLPQGWKLQAGKFKTPIGMEFNQSGPTLEIVKRGFAVGAVIFDRNVGAMLSSPALTPFELRLDGGVFNYGPAAATNVGNPKEGRDYTWAGRLRVEPLPGIELQGFGGLATTSVEQQDGVAVYGGAAEWRPEVALGPVDRLRFEAEAIQRDDPNNDSAAGLAWYVQPSFHLFSVLQPAARWETFDSLNGLKDRSDLTLGLNWFPNPAAEAQAKLMVNWVRTRFANTDNGDGDQIQVMLSVAF